MSEPPLLADLAVFCERCTYLDTVAHERLLLAENGLPGTAASGPKRSLEMSIKSGTTQGATRQMAKILSANSHIDSPSRQLSEVYLYLTRKSETDSFSL